ncbi:hypothetical protein SLA2020_387770 [Shorea laevis]
MKGGRVHPPCSSCLLVLRFPSIGKDTRINVVQLSNCDLTYPRCMRHHRGPSDVLDLELVGCKHHSTSAKRKTGEGGTTVEGAQFTEVNGDNKKCITFTNPHHPHFFLPSGRRMTPLHPLPLNSSMAK